MFTTGCQSALVIAVLLLGSMPTALCAERPQTIPQMWEREIREALKERERFCRSTELGPASDFYGLTDPVRRESIGRTLTAQVASATHPWPAFFSGVLLNTPRDGSGTKAPTQHYADLYLQKAFDLSGNHPGRTWVLIAESRRFGLTAWVEKGLHQLEKSLLSAGAQAAPLVSQQLLQYAVIDESSGNIESASSLYDWALRFDRDLVWSPLRKGIAGFPRSPSRFPAGLAEAAAVLRESWRVQVALARNVAQWVTATLTAFVVGLFFYLIVTYGTAATHSLAHLLPPSLPLRFRSLLANAAALSLLGLGLLPFLWIAVFALWRKLTRRDRFLAAIGAALLVLAPVGTRIEDMLSQPLRPGNSLRRFHEIVDGAYSPEREDLVRSWIRSDSTDYLAFVSAANLQLKKGDVAAARKFVGAAEALRGDDPVVMLTAGNTHYFAEQYEKANTYYAACLERYPELEATYFNPCLYYFGEMKFVEGMNLMERASKLNPRMVSSFLRKNDECFGGDWPRIRHFLLPDYQGKHFWLSALPRYGGSWRSTDELWGPACLGMPAAWYGVAALVLFLVLLVSGSGAPDKSFHCKICGRSICRSCVRTGLCEDCHAHVGGVTDSAVRSHLVAKISRRRALATTIVLPVLFNALFPGLASFHRTDTLRAPMLFIIPTSLAYGYYAVLAGFSSPSPFWAMGRILFPLLFISLFYNTVFVIKSIVALVRGLSQGAK